MSATFVRLSQPTDFPAILSLIKRKAVFDGGLHLLKASDAEIEAAIFGDSPQCEVLVAQSEDRIVGLASFFTTFSTFLATPCLWLDDLFVLPDIRSQGIGRGLLAKLAEIAIDRNCCRLEWTVAVSNHRGIKFYKECGATIRETVSLARLDRHGLEALAAGRPPAT